MILQYLFRLYYSDDVVFLWFMGSQIRFEEARKPSEYGNA